MFLYRCSNKMELVESALESNIKEKEYFVANSNVVLLFFLASMLFMLSFLIEKFHAKIPFLVGVELQKILIGLKITSSALFLCSFYQGKKYIDRLKKNQKKLLRSIAIHEEKKQQIQEQSEKHKQKIKQMQKLLDQMQEMLNQTNREIENFSDYKSMDLSFLNEKNLMKSIRIYNEIKEIEDFLRGKDEIIDRIFFEIIGNVSLKKIAFKDIVALGDEFGVYLSNKQSFLKFLDIIKSENNYDNNNKLLEILGFKNINELEKYMKQNRIYGGLQDLILHIRRLSENEAVYTLKKIKENVAVLYGPKEGQALYNIIDQLRSKFGSNFGTQFAIEVQNYKKTKEEYEFLINVMKTIFNTSDSSTIKIILRRAGINNISDFIKYANESEKRNQQESQEINEVLKYFNLSSIKEIQETLELLEHMFGSSKNNQNGHIINKKKLIEDSYVTLSAQVEEIMSILKKYSKSVDDLFMNLEILQNTLKFDIKNIENLQKYVTLYQHKKKYIEEMIQTLRVVLDDPNINLDNIIEKIDYLKAQIFNKAIIFDKLDEQIARLKKLHESSKKIEHLKKLLNKESIIAIMDLIRDLNDNLGSQVLDSENIQNTIKTANRIHNENNQFVEKIKTDISAKSLHDLLTEIQPEIMNLSIYLDSKDLMQINKEYHTIIKTLEKISPTLNFENLSHVLNLVYENPNLEIMIRNLYLLKNEYKELLCTLEKSDQLANLVQIFKNFKIDEIKKSVISKENLEVLQEIQNILELNNLEETINEIFKLKVLFSQYGLVLENKNFEKDLESFLYVLDISNRENLERYLDKKITNEEIECIVKEIESIKIDKELNGENLNIFEVIRLLIIEYRKLEQIIKDNRLSDIFLGNIDSIFRGIKNFDLEMEKMYKSQTLKQLKIHNTKDLITFLAKLDKFKLSIVKQISKNKNQKSKTLGTNMTLFEFLGTKKIIEIIQKYHKLDIVKTIKSIQNIEKYVKSIGLSNWEQVFLHHPIDEFILKFYKSLFDLLIKNPYPLIQYPKIKTAEHLKRNSKILSMLYAMSSSKDDFETIKKEFIIAIEQIDQKKHTNYLKELHNNFLKVLKVTENAANISFLHSLLNNKLSKNIEIKTPVFVETPNIFKNNINDLKISFNNKYVGWLGPNSAVINGGIINVKNHSTIEIDSGSVVINGLLSISGFDVSINVLSDSFILSYKNNSINLPIQKAKILGINNYFIIISGSNPWQLKIFKDFSSMCKNNELQELTIKGTSYIDVLNYNGNLLVLVKSDGKTYFINIKNAIGELIINDTLAIYNGVKYTLNAEQLTYVE